MGGEKLENGKMKSYLDYSPGRSTGPLAYEH